jgi:hypothetical protein
LLARHPAWLSQIEPDYVDIAAACCAWRQSVAAIAAANLHADRRLIGGDPADNRAQEADVQENASGIWQGAAHECWYSARCFSDDAILSDPFASSIAGFVVVTRRGL